MEETCVHGADIGEHCEACDLGKRDTSLISDGYHTFGELYMHRHMLFIALMMAHPTIAWRANNHSDGTSYEGWFAAGMHLPTGDISYHLPAALWTMLDHSGIATSLQAPEWDGHTSDDVIDRLKRWIYAETVARAES